MTLASLSFLLLIASNTPGAVSLSNDPLGQKAAKRASKVTLSEGKAIALAISTIPEDQFFDLPVRCRVTHNNKGGRLIRLAAEERNRNSAPTLLVYDVEI